MPTSHFATQNSPVPEGPRWESNPTRQRAGIFNAAHWEGGPTCEWPRGAAVLGFEAPTERELAGREAVVRGLADSARSARESGRTTTNPDAKIKGGLLHWGLSCDILWAAHSFAPAKAGRKQFLQEDWTMSVGANAFFPWNTLQRSGTVGRPVCRHLQTILSVGQPSGLASSASIDRHSPSLFRFLSEDVDDALLLMESVGVHIVQTRDFFQGRLQPIKVIQRLLVFVDRRLGRNRR